MAECVTVTAEELNLNSHIDEIGGVKKYNRHTLHSLGKKSATHPLKPMSKKSMPLIVCWNETI